MKTFFASLMLLGIAAASLAQVAPPTGGTTPRMARARLVQQRPGIQSKLILINRQDVQDDLKLTAEESAKIAEINNSMKSKIQDLAAASRGDAAAFRNQLNQLYADMDTQIGKALTPEHAKRFRQIQIQIAGNESLFDAEVIKELKLTNDQLKTLDGMSRDMAATVANLNQKINAGNLTYEQAIIQLDGAYKERDMGIDAKFLTEAQKTSFKEMKGAPFKASETRRGGPRGGNR